MQGKKRLNRRFFKMFVCFDQYFQICAKTHTAHVRKYFNSKFRLASALKFSLCYKMSQISNFWQYHTVACRSNRKGLSLSLSCIASSWAWYVTSLCFCSSLSKKKELHFKIILAKNTKKNGQEWVKKVRACPHYAWWRGPHGVGHQA